MEYFGYALGPIIVSIIRLIVPFIIFRWPFWGGIVTAIFDAIDVILVFLFGWGDYKHYHRTDKVLDTYFLIFMAFFAWKRWSGLEKNIALGLFGWRMIGFVAFEVTGIRPLLLVFPNLFLWWWLFVAARDKYKPKWEITRKRAIIVLAIMIFPKLTQEYILHFAQLQPTKIGANFILGLIGKSN